jgi:tetratricopeptide (TPR) repeat protein
MRLSLHTALVLLALAVPSLAQEDAAILTTSPATSPDCAELFEKAEQSFRKRRFSSNILVGAERQLSEVVRLCEGTPGSFQARDQLQIVNEELADHSLSVAQFYLGKFYEGKGGQQGARSRLKSIIERYPHYSRLDEVILLLGDLSMVEGKIDEAATSYRRLIIEYQSATELVAELGQFSAALPAAVPSNGVPDPKEELRRSIYDRLWTLGAEAVPALNRGLADPNVQIRRNVALYLSVAAGGWYEPSRPRLDIHPHLVALTAALVDADTRVIQLAAQAVGLGGSAASPAVPALIPLLASSDEGSRNSACIGLTGIGTGAREALPALRKALADSSADVRRFAQRAIDAIEK